MKKKNIKRKRGIPKIGCGVNSYTVPPLKNIPVWVFRVQPSGVNPKRRNNSGKNHSSGNIE